MSKPKVIVAASPEGLIGVDGQLPWKKSADLKRFKKTTMGGILIMGRATWESIGRPLPGRQTYVLTKEQGRTWDGVKVFHDLANAILVAGAEGVPIWLAGGASIYAEGLKFCDELDVTIVTEPYVHPNPYVTFKVTCVDWLKGGQVEGFKVASEEQNPDDPTLLHRTYVRE
jgi:dihydrofolate reductase